jgi:hypothetical protein
MTPVPLDVTKLSDQQLRNIIENHRRKGATHSSVYIDALAEQARRAGKGLDFDKSFEVIRRAAAEHRFVSYKELADASGTDWNQVAILAPVYGWFTEGFDTLDLREAKNLLDGLDA